MKSKAENFNSQSSDLFPPIQGSSMQVTNEDYKGTCEADRLTNDLRIREDYIKQVIDKQHYKMRANRLLSGNQSKLMSENLLLAYKTDNTTRNTECL